jgi:outer membrane protein
MKVLRHRSFAVLSVVATIGLAPVARAETFTLEQALSAAYENNFRLQAGRADLRGTDEDVAKALSGWRPSASISGSYGVDSSYVNPFYPVPGGHPRSIGATITQPIYNPLVIPQTHQAKADVRAGRATLTSIEQQVLLAAATAYFDVVQAEENLRIERDNASLLDRQLQSMNIRLSHGDVTRTDVSLVSSRLSSAKSDIAFAEADLAARRATFEQVIGRPAETLDTASALPGAESSEGAALTSALAANPDLLAAREKVRSADAATDVASAELHPVLSVQGRFRQSHDELAPRVFNSDLSAFLQLTVPIYQGGGEQAAIRKAKELETAAVMRMNDVETQVRQIVHTAWQARDAASRAILQNKAQVEASVAAYDGAEQEVKGGERTTYDLLNAAQDLLSARLALARSQRELSVATYRLLAVTGGLTASALRLPVKIYDPVEHYDDNAGRWFGFGE